jgi:hypothetical protein
VRTTTVVPAETSRSPAREPLTSDERASVLAQASAAIAPFKKELSAALTSAMQQGGPLKAIDVCAEIAPRLAARASTEQVQVGRSAIRLRNPRNAAREWLQPMLADMARLDSAQGAQRVARLSDGHYGYAEAIVLQPLLATRATSCAARCECPRMTSARSNGLHSDDAFQLAGRCYRLVLLFRTGKAPRQPFSAAVLVADGAAPPPICTGRTLKWVASQMLRVLSRDASVLGS